MYGAIIGDVAGSYYEVFEINAWRKKLVRDYQERMQIMDKKTPLFNQNCSVTDDSILTTAIADAVLSKTSYEEKLRQYGLRELSLGLDKYDRMKFGPGFINWLKGNYHGNSYGNGCAMRISPIGFLYDDIKKIKEECYKATIPSHNNLESIRCSEAVALSIYLLRSNVSKKQLRKIIGDNYFSLDYNLETLRHKYTFTSRAINSVPQAIFCFIISNDFEDAIRKAISIGGDSDTIACITGALAEAYYGIPDELIMKVRPYINDYMIPIIDKFYDKGKVRVYERNN